MPIMITSFPITNYSLPSLPYLKQYRHTYNRQLRVNSITTMPPKRKALADASTNATQSQPRNAKAAKTSAKCTPAKASTRKSADKTVSTANDKDAAPKAGNKGAPKAATKSRVGAFRYSNADTVSALLPANNPPVLYDWKEEF